MQFISFRLFERLERLRSYFSQKKKTVFSAISAALKQQQTASAIKVEGAAEQILSRSEELWQMHQVFCLCLCWCLCLGVCACACACVIVFMCVRVFKWVCACM